MRISCMSFCQSLTTECKSPSVTWVLTCVACWTLSRCCQRIVLSPRESRASVTSSCVSFVQESQFFHHYELCLSGPPLGEGSFSVCRKCRHKQSGRDYAVKIVSRRWVCTSAVVCVCHSMSLPRWFCECCFSALGWRQTRRGRSLHWDIANLTQTSSSCTKFTLIRYSQSRDTRHFFHQTHNLDSAHQTRFSTMLPHTRNDHMNSRLCFSFPSVPHIFSDGAFEGRRVTGEDQEEEAVWWGRGESAAAEPGVRRQLHARSRSRAQRPEAWGKLCSRGLKRSWPNVFSAAVHVAATFTLCPRARCLCRAVSL